MWPEEFSEGSLIESNQSIQIDSNNFMCWNHRNFFGKNFRSPLVCSHPLHEGKNNFTKYSLVKISYQTYKKLIFHYGTAKIFSYFCKKCLHAPIAPATDTSTESDSNEEESNVKVDDPIQDPEFKIDDKEQNFSNINAELTSAGKSPIKNKWLSNNFESYSKSTKNYTSRKYKEYLNLKSEQFASAVVPNDPESFLKYVNNEAEEIENPELLSLDQIKYLYEKATGRAKLAVLTMGTATFSNRRLVDALHCSMRQVKNARKVFEETGICSFHTKTKQKRIKIDREKVKSFLQYLFSTGMIKIAAYGTSVHKYSIGTKILVPKPIIVGSKLQLIHSYKDHCTALGLESLSESTLFRIFDDLKPSERAIVCCLDNFLVEGQESVQEIIEIVTTIKPRDEKELITKLKNIETYVKINFSSRLSDDSSCISHCPVCALSDDSDPCFSEKCLVNHGSKCVDCENVVDTLKIVENLIDGYNGTEKESFKFDFEIGKTRILNWMGHQVRSKQQEKAKTDTFNKMKSDEAILIRDWAQKFLPQKNHEAMSDYFAKSGISAHVDCFFTKDETTGEVKKHVYHVLADKTDQGAMDTLSVFDVVLKQFREDNPGITKLHIRSDNAGAYKANNVLESLGFIAAKYGFQIKTYHFSESQDGKDQNDREAAMLKAHTRCYIKANRANKVTNSMEFKTGILYRGGPKRCKVAVMSMDTNSKILNKKDLPNITKYHSFVFESEGYRVWKYYRIGPGKFIKYGNTSFVHAASVLSNFNEVIRDQSMTHRESPQLNTSWYCNEECCEVFETEEELLAHKLAGTHNTIQIKNSTDVILSEYRKLASTSINELHPTPIIPVKNCSDLSDEYVKYFKRGWALPQRSSGKLDQKAKKFCLDFFAEGLENNRKYNHVDIAREMKRAKNPETNEQLFTSENLLSSKQIRSLLSRYSTLVKKMKLTKQDLQNDSQNVLDLMPVVRNYVLNENNNYLYFFNLG